MLYMMEKDNLRKYIKIDDVINYGILTEFIGRFPLIVSLNSLNKEELKKIAKIEIEREITNYFSSITNQSRYFANFNYFCFDFCLLSD